MATTLSLASVAGPCATRVFAGGDATSWCKVTGPSWLRSITVYNRGTGSLYVSVPGLTGSATVATDHAVVVPAGSARTFNLTGGQAQAANGAPTWSVFGADGATHPMDFQLEAAP